MLARAERNSGLDRALTVMLARRTRLRLEDDLRLARELAMEGNVDQKPLLLRLGFSPDQNAREMAASFMP